MKCLICDSTTKEKATDVFQCSNCQFVFKNPEKYSSDAVDFKRYSTHQNSKIDPGYIAFLRQVVTPLANFLPKKFTALDFGCGPGPTLSILLNELGGEVELYDPFFFKDTKQLEKTYEVVTCTEVVEHFKNPREDWIQLVSLVQPEGLLAVMTLFIHANIDYQSWWYKNDITHVGFYSEETIVHLAKHFHLDIIFNDNKSVVIFKKL